MLYFLGRGSAFSNEHNCAFFVDDNDNLVLLDCPATAYQKLKLFNLESFHNIYVLVTHTHGDHSGGIGMFAQYVYFVLHKKITVIAPSQDVYDDLYTLLMRIEGCDESWLNLTTINKMNLPWLRQAIPTTHSEQLDGKCFGWLLRLNHKNIIYTGDTAELDHYLPYLSRGDILYTEAAAYSSPVHLYLPKILPKLKELTENGITVYLMHTDNESMLCEMIQNTMINFAPLLNEE